MFDDVQRNGRSQLSRLFDGWRKRAAIWALCTLGLMAGLVVSLGIQANPWRLEMKVPSGYPERDYDGCIGWDRQNAGLSPDGRLLAVGRPNSQIQVWDISTGLLQTTLGKAIESDDTRQPALTGVGDIHWLPDSRRLAVRRALRWQVFDLAGNETPVPDPDRCRHAKPAPLPEKPLLAMADIKRMEVVDLAAGVVAREWTFTHSGGGTRIDWTTDGRYLLLNGLLGVRVWDVTSGQPVFFHRELDMALPPPNIADDASGSDAQDARLTDTRPKDVTGSDSSGGASEPPSNVALLVDSRFSRDGTFVVSLYSGEIALSLRPVPATNRLRFYDTATGKLLWDEQLLMAPRGMELSPDGSRLYVLSVVDSPKVGTSICHIYDVKTRSLLRQVSFGHNFLYRLRPMPDNRWVVAYGSELWLIDTLEQCAPQRLPGSPNVNDVIVTADGKAVIEVGEDKTIRLWRQRREMSEFGAWVLPETWGLYGLSIALCLGPVIIAGRDRARSFGGRLPRALWVLVVLAALWLALSLAGDVVQYVTGPLYASGQDGPGRVTALVKGAVWLLALMSLLGMMRLRRGWNSRCQAP